MFKHFFDNLQEPVIIIKDHQVKYCNDQFLNKFKCLISQATVSKTLEPLPRPKKWWKRIISKLTRAAQFKTLYQSSFFMVPVFQNYT